MRPALSHLAALPALAALAAPAAGAGQPRDAGAITLETAYVRYVIGAGGRNLHWIDRRSGRDYLAQTPPAPFASITKGGQSFGSTSAVTREGCIHVQFGASGVEAAIRPTAHRRYLTLEVVSVSGEPDALALANIPLTLRGQPDEPFASCALALNLKTNVPDLPGAMSRLLAFAYRRFGLVGARVALVACPQKRLRELLQEVVSEAEELPHSPLGGPWALDAPANKESYLFNFGGLSEETVDSWISLARSMGVTQIDFHGGDSFRFGDYRPNPKTYPRGLASLKAVIDRLHAAGIQAGLHTYSFFLAKDCPWVTPVPDPRLAKGRSFTLAEALSPEAAVVPVVEPTQGMSTTTGFLVANSVTLQIDEELVIYSGVSTEPPYAFTGCRRGAYGTRVSAHAKGARAHHLKELFGLFLPDGDSTLFTEVAARTAEVFNACGFDMIYLDALDGSFAVDGGENAWHHGSRFVFELWKRLAKPALMEMSIFHHHLWYVRSRMGAWDCPSKGYKRFVDIHALANGDSRRMFMPPHLGWWGVFPWDGIQPERTFPDDVEYLCAKALGHDCGLSFQVGFDPGTFPGSHNAQRLAGIIRRYQELRRGGRVPERVKAKLRVPGDEYTLVDGPGGQPRFQPIAYDRHRVEGLDGRTDRWSTDNRFGRQPLQVRIEALFSPAPYESPEAIALAEFAGPDPLPDRRVQDGVSVELETVAAPARDGHPSARLSAESRRAGREGAWAMAGKTLAPPLDLNRRGLGVWVYGDGQGEVLNFQVRSPEHVTPGVAEHYVLVDFTGWRYCELVEPESDRLSRYSWPYSCSQEEWGKDPAALFLSAYTVYHPWVHYGQVGHLNVWVNQLPPGRKVECILSPVRALPLRKVKLRRPSITLDGRTLTFPVELESGCYLELRSLSDCKLYGPAGELLGDVVPQGTMPVLAKGDNAVQFACEAPEGLSARANVTVISRGVAKGVGGRR